MNIDIEKLDNLIADADKVFISAEAESVLLEFLDIKDQVADAEKALKEQLAAAALEINPNFQSIKSDNLKVYFRQYGARYKLDESRIKETPKELYKTETKYSVIPKEVDNWTKHHDGMPIGIHEPDRPKQISFSRKDEVSYETP